jgi:malonate decarboxylase delta subunit
MEKLDFEYPAGAPARQRAMVGVVGSGDLEVLLEPGTAGRTTVRVTTSVNGYGGVWKAQIDRLFAGRAEGDLPPAADIEINDFGATPGVVGLRVAQAFDALKAAGADAGAQGEPR